MSRHTWYSNVAIAAVVVAGLSGCATGTGPAEAGAGAVETEVLHEVHVRFDSLTVMGSCDHNSIFESASDGEFDFELSVADADAYATDFRRKMSDTLKAGSYSLDGSWTVRVLRDVARPIGLRIHFWATERDGLLGKDPAMSQNRWVTHQWNGTTWTGGRKIELVGGEKCGVRVRYTITSSPVE